LQHNSIILDFTASTLVKYLWGGIIFNFLLVLIGAILFASWGYTTSTVLGSFIALINFYSLERTIRNTKQIKVQTHYNKHKYYIVPLRKILIKYYLRFGATVFLLLVLIRQKIVEPLGLLTGLSIIILAIIAWTIAQAKY